MFSAKDYTSDAHSTILMGMVGGPDLAIQTLHKTGNRMHGKATEGYKTLHVPPVSASTRKRMEAWGFVFPEDTPVAPESRYQGTHLVYPLEAPEGWEVRGTDHWLYKHLVDPKGQVRMQFMVHTQDRDSWAHLVPKYTACSWSRNQYSKIHPAINDSSGNRVWIGKEHDGDNKGRPDYQAVRAIGEAILETTTKGKMDLTDDKWFDGEPINFPESEYMVPALRDYRVDTSYYHKPDDHYAADSGSETLTAAGDKEAIEIVTRQASNRSYGYHIKTVLCDPSGQEIWRHETPRPGPQKGHMICGGFGYCDEYGRLHRRR